RPSLAEQRGLLCAAASTREQQLDRDFAIELGIVGAIDRPATPAATQLEQHVARQGDRLGLLTKQPALDPRERLPLLEPRVEGPRAHARREARVLVRHDSMIRGRRRLFGNRIRGSGNATPVLLQRAKFPLLALITLAL